MATLELIRQQRKIRFDEASWLKQCQLALDRIKAERVPDDFPEEIGLVCVDDTVIAQIHGDFLNDPAATDVITFQHGEIIISVETAQREASERGLILEEELLRYAVHGMLHLAGHDDHEAPEREAMHARQEAIIQEVRAA